MTNVVAACESQIRLMSVGLDNIQLLSEDAIKQVRSIVRSAGTQVQGKPAETTDTKEDQSKGRKWKIWDLEFESQMRMLDNAVSSLR